MAALGIQRRLKPRASGPLSSRSPTAMLSRMAEQFDRVTVTAAGPVAVLAFNQPEMTQRGFRPHDRGRDGGAGFHRGEGKFRALVLTGEGKGFLRRGQSGRKSNPGLSAPATCWSGSIILSCAGCAIPAAGGDGGEWRGGGHRHELRADRAIWPSRRVRHFSSRALPNWAWCRMAARPGCCRGWSGWRGRASWRS